jgi:hypothetical protein
MFLIYQCNELQSGLPPGGKPLCFILYADKTKLSSFGSDMGYPVYARIGNLDVGIRNTDGIGGGELVGWLPIVGIKNINITETLSWLTD